MFRSERIFLASPRLRNCRTFSFRAVGGWNIACNNGNVKLEQNRVLTFFLGHNRGIWQVSKSASSKNEWTRISWNDSLCFFSECAFLTSPSGGGLELELPILQATTPTACHRSDQQPTHTRNVYVCNASGSRKEWLGAGR